jgi:hypothetical protein
MVRASKMTSDLVWTFQVASKSLLLKPDGFWRLLRIHGVRVASPIDTRPRGLEAYIQFRLPHPPARDSLGPSTLSSSSPSSSRRSPRAATPTIFLLASPPTPVYYSLSPWSHPQPRPIPSHVCPPLPLHEAADSAPPYCLLPWYRGPGGEGEVEGSHYRRGGRRFQYRGQHARRHALGLVFFLKLGGFQAPPTFGGSFG